ncbi:MAG: Holliday junction resolvase RuvX [Microscillaceae bacterium]|jgi:putative Holliday junction resolvase|nr:Holliday junction resolvase RuvX [Microscillaceae bacterium]
MPRIIAIDYGSKRVGLAVTDPLQIIATALDTIHAKDVIDYLKKYLQNEDVEAFVVGKPSDMLGKPTDATPLVEAFVNLLKKNFPEKPIHLHDERFTSKMALAAMIAGGTKKKDRQNKGNIDKVSAVIILQSYLEQNKQ